MEQLESNGELELDLKEIIGLLLTKFWIIALSGIALALLSFLVSHYALTPMYQSTTKVYVMNRENTSATITYADLQTGAQLTKDYMTLVTSRPVTEKVIAELGLNTHHDALVKMISVTNPANTRILEITVEYPDPSMAKQIADSIRKASSNHISSVMNIEKVTVVEEANLPEHPSSPNVLMNTLIGGVLGGMLSVFVIFLIYMLDDTIKTPDDIEKYLGISVLGSIPMQKELKESGSKKRFSRQKKNNKSKH
jgi:capsular polysaccharide biosynthesis protein